MDWPVWAACKRSHGSYKNYTKDALLAVSCSLRKEEVLSHVAPVAYHDLVQSESEFAVAFKAGLKWDTLIGHLSLSRLRTGMIILGHLNEKRSSAKVLSCISCGKRYTGMYFHVLCVCPAYAQLRSVCKARGLVCDSLQVLCTSPSHQAFDDLVALTVQICKDSDMFWLFK